MNRGPSLGCPGPSALPAAFLSKNLPMALWAKRRKTRAHEGSSPCAHQGLSGLQKPPRPVALGGTSLSPMRLRGRAPETELVSVPTVRSCFLFGKYKIQ